MTFDLLPLALLCISLLAENRVVNVSILALLGLFFYNTMPQLPSLEQDCVTDKPSATVEDQKRFINDSNETTMVSSNFIGDPTLAATPYITHSIPDSKSSNQLNNDNAENTDTSRLSKNHLKFRTLTRQKVIRRHHRYSTISSNRFSIISNDRIKMIVPTQKECQICTETFDYPHFFPISSECTHENNICTDCVRMHIKSEVVDKGNVRIRCPFFTAGCLGVMQEWDVKKFASNEDFERYQKLLINSVLSEIKDFRWCSNPKCGSGQIHEDGHVAPIMTCNACHQKSCVIHDIPIHAGQSCSRCKPTGPTGRRSTAAKTQKVLVNLLKKSETLHKKEEKARRKEAARQEKLRKYEIKSEKLIKTQTKQCPKCSRDIQKISGCDHMRCTVACQHEFCWLCLADYDPIRKEGNHRHMPSCNHYRAYIES